MKNICLAAPAAPIAEVPPPPSLLDTIERERVAGEVIDSTGVFKTTTDSFNRGWKAGYQAGQQSIAVDGAPSTGSAAKFDAAEFDAMVELGTAAWKDAPAEWLEKLRGDGVVGWQPIETAPKDTALLLFCHGCYELGHFNTALELLIHNDEASRFNLSNGRRGRTLLRMLRAIGGQ